MKILFHYDAGNSLERMLDQYRADGCEIVCCPEGEDEPFLSELGDADVLWHTLQPVDANVIARAPQLKLIQKIGIGVNTIDLDAAKASDIAVCNMPGTNSRAVAEHALLLMLACLRQLGRTATACRSGRWRIDEATRASMGEIEGRTVGLVGFGDIPAMLAPLLTAMGAQVVYTARNKKNVVFEYLSLDELLARSDIVSLHIPLTDETEKLLNAERIATMRPGSVLVNTARGEIIDENALCAALRSGQIAAAGLDVFVDEPISKDRALLQFEQVVATPHVAWVSDQTFARSFEVAMRNSLAAMGEGDYVHRVV